MTSSVDMADKLQRELNDKLGARQHDLWKQDDVMDAVMAMMARTEPDFQKRDDRVGYLGAYEGKLQEFEADVAFACFGEGDDVAWVAFCFYQDGNAYAVRPLTPETRRMGWLEEYITKELAG